MCDNKRAWLFNLLMAATMLIQHVAHVADATENSMPPTKRDTSAANARMTTGDAPLNTEVDYAVYMNDFNMQDEATIPEDILDQQHIQDGTLDVVGGVGDIVASEDAQYDGDADQDVADIILESHRPTPMNSSSTHNGPGTNLKSSKNENPNPLARKDEKSSSLNRGNFIYNNNNNNVQHNDKNAKPRSTPAIDGMKFQGHVSKSKTAPSDGDPRVGEKFNKVSGVSAENTINVANSIDVDAKGPGRNDNDDDDDDGPTAIGDIEDDGQRSDDDSKGPELNADLVLKRTVLHDRIDVTEHNQSDDDDDNGAGADERAQQSRKATRHGETLMAAWTKSSRFGEIRYSNESATKPDNQTATMTYVQQQQLTRAADKTESQQWPAKADGHRQSAFELFKAERRNGPHNGHKNHKKKYKDYLKFVQAANKSSGEPMRRLPASPFFAVPKRVATPKPFYEGQINYFLETKDDEGDTGEHVKSHPRNWYRGVGPALRNGFKGGRLSEDHDLSHLHHNHHHHHQHEQQHAKPLSHHHHQHHYHNREPHRRRLAPRQHHNHHGLSKQPQQQRPSSGNPYQRKPPALSTQSPSPMVHHDYDNPKQHDTTQAPPTPPPEYPHGRDGAMHELGHQITQMDELERYYAKWPHLARVQFQVYDEHYREAHPELYDADDERAESAEYDEYESTAELEEAQRHNAEADLPPYIKKYNRRNKQLLNLLEGTIAPPTVPPQYRGVWSKSLLQPGPHESSATGGGVSSPIRLDDDYMKEKRRRYHLRYGYNNNNNDNFKHLQEDLFAQQRNEGSQPHPTSDPQTSATVATIHTDGNHLPDEDVSISMHDDAWHSEVNSKSLASEMGWQIGTTAAPSSADASKPAVFKLPSYPAIAGNFMGKARSRSSVQLPSPMGQARLPSTGAPSTAVPQRAKVRPPINGRSINSFVYHRVEDTSPRLVGTGSTGHKQRLPFVAITDRRLEMSKKALLERQKELEQNHFPMP